MAFREAVGVVNAKATTGKTFLRFPVFESVFFKGRPRKDLRKAACAVAFLAVFTGLSAAFGQSTASEGEWLEAKPSDPASVEHELSTLFRLLRHGSGKDRVQVRARMAALGRDAVTGIAQRVDEGAPILSRSASLVLGELRDPRAAPALIRAGGEAGKGDPVGALFALGRLRSLDATPTLTVQAASARSHATRVAAALALGRCAAPESVGRLAELMDGAKLDAEVLAFATALGLTSDAAAVPALARASTHRSDRVRRAATCALASLGAGAAEQALVARLSDEDPEVRLAALEGLALVGSVATTSSDRMKKLAASSDPVERAAAAMVVASRGGSDAEAAIARFSRDPSEKVRAAALSGAIARPGLALDALIASHGADGHDLPRVASAIVVAVRAARGGRFDVGEAACEDRSAEVRDAGLVALAWLRGAAARPYLQKVVAARREDRVVDRAKSLLRILEQNPSVAHRILRAELQVLLDDAGLAASWAPLARLNRYVILAADVHDALPEEQFRAAPAQPSPGFGGPGVGGGGSGGGGGSPPSSGGGQGARPKRRAPPPEDEDLRRHLERHPYADRREVLEIPLVR
jgi:HEAT repeat protein